GNPMEFTQGDVSMNVTMMRLCEIRFVLLMSLAPLVPGQTTTSMMVNISGTSTSSGIVRGAGGGAGTLAPFGDVSLSLFNAAQQLDASLNPIGPLYGSFNLYLNRLDALYVSVAIPNLPIATISGFINGGSGLLANASGSVTLTLTQGPKVGNNGVAYTMTGAGSVTVGQKTTAVTLDKFTFTLFFNPEYTISANGTGTEPSLGNVTMKVD